MGVIVDLIFPKIRLGFVPCMISMIQIHSDHQCCINGTNEITLDKDSLVPLMNHNENCSLLKLKDTNDL